MTTTIAGSGTNVLDTWQSQTRNSPRGMEITMRFTETIANILSSMSMKAYEMDRFYVTSRNENYLIDISELCGNGWCGCKDFQYRHLPTLEQEINRTGRIQQIRRCKHLKFAAQELLKSTEGQFTTFKEVNAAGDTDDEKIDRYFDSLVDGDMDDDIAFTTDEATAAGNPGTQPPKG